jgi:hypothetical protein
MYVVFDKIIWAHESDTQLRVLKHQFRLAAIH